MDEGLQNIRGKNLRGLMVKKLKVYLDTSVINFLFAYDSPEKRETTAQFFEDYVKPQKIEAYISDVVIGEIMKTPDRKKRALLQNVVKEYEFILLYLNEESEHLGELYVQNGIIPPKKIEDAYHIAITTVNELDILVSWNFRHLANINKERMITAVNLREGYIHPLRLTTPMEVMG